MSAKALEALKLFQAYEAMSVDRGGKDGPKGRAYSAFVAAKDVALKETTNDDIIARFEAAFPEYHWHTAKGRLQGNNPLIYTASITSGRTPLGAGESNISASEAFAVAFGRSGLEWSR
jgi:hypothetical protein